MGTDYQRTKRRRAGQGNWRLIRYCDDFGVMVAGSAEKAEVLREQIAAVLFRLGLRLSVDKTRVVHIDDGFDFLGQHIRRQRNAARASSSSTTARPRKPSRRSRTGSRNGPTGTPADQSLAALLNGLNRMLAGWANYLHHGVSKKTFAVIDRHAWQRIARWLLRKHRIPRSHLRRFCDQGWRFAEGSFHSASSVAIVRYRYCGATIPTPWTIEPVATS
ncbi:group II intron maturase-specific domain-containing protein [Nonomuraea fuscirosea]|uniref:group II intron maturase-specific domain-containing protein n=1 Tax=Nonomuraea fuscirosea TaxID=1291556 RepID=UPI0033F2E24C